MQIDIGEFDFERKTLFALSGQLKGVFGEDQVRVQAPDEGKGKPRIRVTWGGSQAEFLLKKDVLFAELLKWSPTPALGDEVAKNSGWLDDVEQEPESGFHVRVASFMLTYSELERRELLSIARQVCVFVQTSDWFTEDQSRNRDTRRLLAKASGQQSSIEKQIEELSLKGMGWKIAFSVLALIVILAMFGPDLGPREH